MVITYGEGATKREGGGGGGGEGQVEFHPYKKSSAGVLAILMGGGAQQVLEYS